MKKVGVFETQCIYSSRGKNVSGTEQFHCGAWCVFYSYGMNVNDLGVKSKDLTSLYPDAREILSELEPVHYGRQAGAIVRWAFQSLPRT